MPNPVLLAIDQGTTGTRAIVYDRYGIAISTAYLEFTQYYPKPGWVEHDAAEIWRKTLRVIREALGRAHVASSRIAAIGITNQRETTVLWDRKTGRPVHRALVWQDRRTAAWTDGLKKRGAEKNIRKKTGLVADPYFSASKIRWLLDSVPGLRARVRKGQIAFGTIDSWLIWNLTGGRTHATDCTNASRTLLYNIRTKRWDPELLALMKIPKNLLPQVLKSSALFGKTRAVGALGSGIPILSVMGDQQAALYGQACYGPGQAKNTYGTGCFVVMNVGKKLRQAPFGLLSTLACDSDGEPLYALEGSIFIAGAAIGWLRDGLGWFRKARESEALALSVKDAHGVTVIPALSGLGSPYWKPHVRGAIFGLSRGVRKEHIIRATLESIAHQTVDVVEVMQRGSGHKLHELRTDGGATGNRFLMQFQADLLGLPVWVSDLAESTAWGAAKLAGHTAGLWPDLTRLDRKRKYRKYLPRLKKAESRKLRNNWKAHIQRLLFS